MKNLILFFALTALIACKNQNSEKAAEEPMAEEPQAEAVMSEEAPAPDKSTKKVYVPQSSDDQMAAGIGNALKNDLLRDDLAAMQDTDRKFQYYSVDLNDDGKNETFVSFMSPYFCGSGGCTVLLLDHEASVITRFTVMDTPIWAEKTTTNGWRNLLVRSGGDLKELKYDGSTYPSNPSVVPTASFDAPSGSAIIMFDDNFAKAKTYTF